MLSLELQEHRALRPYTLRVAKSPRKGSRTLATDPREIVPPEPGARISTLRPVGTDGSSLSIVVNRRKVATVETAWAMDRGLTSEMPWTQELADEVFAAAKLRAAFAHAIRLLGTRQRSSFDLVRRLKQAGHAESDARAATDRLIAIGVLSDEDFAKRAAEQLARSGKYGTRAIETKLRTKGVPGDLARSAARAGVEEEGVEDAAAAVAQKRARQLTRLEPEVARRRLYAFLIRRGFDHDEAREATRAALSAEPDDDLH